MMALKSWWMTGGLFLVLVFHSSELRAQGGLPDSVSVIELRPDRFVRIQLPDLGRVSGRVGRRTASELTLVQGGEDRAVPLAAIDSLWVRGRRTGTGAIIGAILGGGGGAFLGALADGLCEFDCGGNSVLPGALLGAGAGAITGGLIGAAIPRWKRVFPR